MQARLNWMSSFQPYRVSRWVVEVDQSEDKQCPASSGWSGVPPRLPSSRTSELFLECCWKTWRTLREPAELLSLEFLQRCSNRRLSLEAFMHLQSWSYWKSYKHTRIQKKMYVINYFCVHRYLLLIFIFVRLWELLRHVLQPWLESYHLRWSSECSIQSSKLVIFLSIRSVKTRYSCI